MSIASSPPPEIAPVGEVVARGKIKVDARKALHKLRDHMLVDLHLWAAEIGRAAVSVGATHLDIEWDADDVILSFDGRALAPTDIASVRDHVLSPRDASGNDDRDALRLLGIGVTAALGLGPSFVDVYSNGMRVRFDATYIDDETSEPPAPSAADSKENRVHVRKKLGIDVLGRAVRREVPREIALLLDATTDAPLVVRGKGVGKRAGSPDVVLRVDLDVPEATRAVLEVLRPRAGWRAERTFLERGVRLATYVGIDAWGLDDADLPLRVVVDAKRLPTNASRSELRDDHALVRRVKERIPRALEIALEALSGAHEGRQETRIGHAVELVDARPEALRAALGAVAASIALASRSGVELPGPARVLLDAPLMMDAVGAPLTLTRVIEAMTRPPVQVFRGAFAEDPTLAMWLGGIPWLRGASVERLLHAEPLVDVESLVAEARAGGARRARALAHPPSSPVLTRTPSQVLVEKFVVEAGPFEGLEGEVAITRREGELRRGASLHVFVEGRLLEVVPLPGTALPLEMALAWPRRFRPRRAYDGVERTEAIERAVHYALRVAAVAIGERVSKRDPELARLAIGAFVAATVRLKDITPSLVTLGKLATEPAWPTTDRGVFVSLADLDAYVRRTGALCIGPAGAGRAADGRPVLEETQLTAVLDLLTTKPTVVPYERALAVPPGEPLDWIGRAASTMFAHVQVTRPNVAGIVGVAGGNDARRHRIFHRGFLIRDFPRPGGASLVVEDLGAVPKERFDGALFVTPVADVEREERALVEIVVDRCERGDLDPVLVESFLADAAEDVESRDPALHARIVEVPKRAARAHAEKRKAELLARAPDTTPRPTGPSGSVTVLGTGTVTAIVPPIALLDTWSIPPATVLYGGRVLTSFLINLPVVAFVEIAREEHVGDDWSSLSESGQTWAKNAIVSAAIEVIKNGAARAEFAGDLGLLKLAAALLDEPPTVASRIDHALRKVKWPTVQGATWSIGESGEREPIPVARRAYASWLREDPPSPFDAPAVYRPQSVAGELRARILRALGCETKDVTDALSRLQEQRARRAKNPAPKLPGAPIHPRLRVDLATLGATCADGQIEIVEATQPEVHRVDASGVAAPFTISTPLPVRVLFRCDAGDAVRAAQEIEGAAEKLVRTLVRDAATLPPCVRAAARILLCSAVASSDDAGDLERIALFPDVVGKRSLTLAEMRGHDTIRVVTDPPPHPEPDDGPPIVFLWPTEKDALSRVVRFADVTASLREIALGDQRRAAPPIERAVLDDELRRACLLVVPINAGALTGEVGILAPAHASLRGVRLHYAMRPLVTLPDNEGWPTIAVLNDDSVVPTRAFTGLASRNDAARIKSVIRAAAAPQAAQLFASPADALGVIRLPFPFYTQPPDRVPCIGVLWLDPTWPERPEVHVESTGHVDPFHVPRLASAGDALSDVVPVRGKVLVACEARQLNAALEDVFRHAKQRLGSLVAAAGRAVEKKADPEVIAAYEWELRLLGARTDRDPKIELATDRPDEILLRVVARRAPHLLHIEETAPPSEPAPAPAAVEIEFAPQSSPPSFFHGLVRRLVELVSGPEPVKDPALTGALTDAIVAMKLTGTPVAGVREGRRGRPVRFDEHTKHIVVNTQHDSVRALADNPARILFLLTAAVSEVNRQLEPVTDAEELNVVLDLLRSS